MRLLDQYFPEVAPGLRFHAQRMQASAMTGLVGASIAGSNLAALYALIVELRIPADPTVATISILLTLIWWIRLLWTAGDTSPSIGQRAAELGLPLASFVVILSFQRWDVAWMLPAAAAAGAVLVFIKAGFFLAFANHLEVDQKRGEIRLYRSRIYHKPLQRISIEKAIFRLQCKLSAMNTASQLTISVFVHLDDNESAKELEFATLYSGIITHSAWDQKKAQWEAIYGQQMLQLGQELRKWVG